MELISNKLKPRDQSKKLWGKARIGFYNICVYRNCFDKFQNELVSLWHLFSFSQPILNIPLCKKKIEVDMTIS